MFDTRIGLNDGQVFSARWDKRKQIENLIALSDWKQEESEIPVSACGTRLAVLPTVQMAATLATSNFIQLNKNKETFKPNIIFDAFNYSITAY
jgi:hypothetical protein